MNDRQKRSAEVLSSKHYPYKSSKPTTHRNMFILGLGSNVAMGRKSSIDILESVYLWLFSHSQIHIVQTSPIWRNPPFGFKLQSDFYNALLVCESDLGLIEIYRLMFYLERRFGRGRKRVFKNAPRTLDIDLILFNTLRLRWKHLCVPHRFYTQRSSVMLPLSFIES